MKRKIGSCLLATVFLATVSLAEAQQAKKMARIGYLSAASASSQISRLEAFRRGLRQLGYFEGQNIAIELRAAEGMPDRVPELANELVRLKVDVIVVSGTASALPAKKATTTIPIVFVIIGDPVELGLVASLARPGGNVTGLTQMANELIGKRLELLKEAVPNVVRVAVLWNPTNPGADNDLKEIEATARALRLKLQVLEVKAANDIETAIQAAAKGNAGAIMTLGDPVTFSHRERIVNLVAKSRLPAMYPVREWTDSGGLMVYAANYEDMFRRAATYVDKILKGTKPADLPVERPINFELIINLKAAKQIGFTVPPNLLARADKVIR